MDTMTEVYLVIKDEATEGGNSITEVVACYSDRLMADKHVRVAINYVEAHHDELGDPLPNYYVTPIYINLSVSGQLRSVAEYAGMYPDKVSDNRLDCYVNPDLHQKREVQ